MRGGGPRVACALYAGTGATPCCCSDPVASFRVEPMAGVVPSGALAKPETWPEETEAETLRVEVMLDLSTCGVMTENGAAEPAVGWPATCS